MHRSRHLGHTLEPVINEFEGHTRADFLRTGRWMGVQEVRNAAGQPVAEWTLVDLGGEGVDFSQPIPTPAPGALAALFSLVRRTARRARCVRPHR